MRNCASEVWSFGPSRNDARPPGLGHFPGGTIKIFQLIAGPGRPWKKRCVVTVRRSALAPFAAIQASQTGSRPSVVSQTPMKPSRLAS